MIYEGSVDLTRQAQIDALLLMEDKEDMHHILDNFTLLPFQAIGSMYMYLSKNCILGDSPGLGKTIQVAGLFKLLELYGELKKVICIVPTSSIYQFASMIESATGMKLLPVFGGKDQIDKLWSRGYENYDGIITAPSSFSHSTALTYKLLPVKDDFNVCVFDESIALQNKDTIIYPTIEALFGYMEYKVLLNGTAITRNLEQFVNQVEILDPHMKGLMSKVNREYKVGEGYRKTQTLPNRFKYHYLGRDRKVLNLVPQHSYEAIIVEPTQEQIEDMTGGGYQEVLFCPEGDLNEDRLPALEVLIERVKQHLPKSNIVIYAFHQRIKPVIKEILEAEVGGCKVGIIDGTVSDPRIREDIRLDFENGVTNVMVTNITRFLNLGSADTMIMYGLPESDLGQLVLRIERNVHKITPKTYEIITYVGTPQIKQIKRLGENEALLNETFDKSHATIKSIIKQVNLADKLYKEYGGM